MVGISPGVYPGRAGQGRAAHMAHSLVTGPSKLRINSHPDLATLSLPRCQSSLPSQKHPCPSSPARSSCPGMQVNPGVAFCSRARPPRTGEHAQTGQGGAPGSAERASRCSQCQHVLPQAWSSWADSAGEATTLMKSGRSPASFVSPALSLCEGLSPRGRGGRRYLPTLLRPPWLTEQLNPSSIPLPEDTFASGAAPG